MRDFKGHDKRPGEETLSLGEDAQVRYLMLLRVRVLWDIGALNSETLPLFPSGRERRRRPRPTVGEVPSTRGRASRRS
jgi:hypothetical protein